MLLLEMSKKMKISLDKKRKELLFNIRNLFRD
jgi:hypothetical protein